MSVHRTILEFLRNLLFKLFELLFNLWVDVARLLQLSTSETNRVPTWRAWSLSKHSIPYLTEVRLTVDILCYHGLRWHFNLVVMVILLWRQQWTEEPAMILRVYWAESMTHIDSPVVSIVMGVTCMNAWTELGWGVNLSRGFAPVTLLCCSLGANHLHGIRLWVYTYFSINDCLSKLICVIWMQLSLLLCYIHFEFLFLKYI